MQANRIVAELTVVDWPRVLFLSFSASVTFIFALLAVR